MFNEYPFNDTIYKVDNKGYTRNTPEGYSQSVITAVAHIEKGLSTPKFVIGGKGGASSNEYALFKKGATYSFNMWQSTRYNIGSAFNIVSIELPLSTALAADMLIIPVLNFDDGERLVAGKEIELVNYPDAPKQITLTPYTFNSDVHGEKNFVLELHFRGTALIGVSLPIIIEIETESQG